MALLMIPSVLLTMTACKMHLILGLTIGLDERASINKEPTS